MITFVETKALMSKLEQTWTTCKIFMKGALIEYQDDIPNEAKYAISEGMEIMELIKPACNEMVKNYKNIEKEYKNSNKDMYNVLTRIENKLDKLQKENNELKAQLKEINKTK